jgi:hypothetical protein
VVAILGISTTSPSVPVLEAVGTMDRIEAGSHHPVVVMFDLRHLGVQWVDRFKGDELVVVVGERE